MAREEPKLGVDIQLGHHMALAIGAAIGGNLGDPVHHQHGRQRELRVAKAKHFAAAAGKQAFVVNAGGAVCHGYISQVQCETG